MEDKKQVIRPLYDRVIIQELGDMPRKTSLATEWSPSADSSDTAFKIGVILRKGLKCTEVEPGIVVAYNKFQTLNVCENGEELVQIREQDLMHVIENFDLDAFKKEKEETFKSAKKTSM